VDIPLAWSKVGKKKSPVKERPDDECQRVAQQCRTEDVLKEHTKGKGRKTQEGISPSPVGSKMLGRLPSKENCRTRKETYRPRKETFHGGIRGASQEWNNPNKPERKR